MSIHPSAIVHPDARIDPTTEIGPFCMVGPHVVLGPDNQLMAHVVIDNHTTLGRGNIIHPFVRLGGVPQDKKYRGEPGRLLIGDHNVIREGATLNIGTENGGMQTTVGSQCLLMAYVHVAHDCSIGDGAVLANGLALAGHVEVHAHVIISGLVGVHQYSRIGRLAYVCGGAMVRRDLPPFCLAQGDPATLGGLNVVGLRRSGWPATTIRAVHAAFVRLFCGAQIRRDILTELEEAAQLPEVHELCAFVRGAPRGISNASAKLSAAHL